VLLGLNVPDPPDHKPPVAPPPTVPARVTFGFPEHTLWLIPGATVGLGFTVIVLFAVIAVHPAGTFVVNLKVTVPLKLAAGV
jgi:hypothetical protein